MMFVAGELRVTLATIHVPLADVSERLTRDKLLTTIRLTRECLVERLQIGEPRIALLGLNPHRGRRGDVRNEEATHHRAGAADRAGEGLGRGRPVSADSFFFGAVATF